MCIFCNIIQGEIPATKVYEDEIVLAFKDIHPKASTHLLIIPKVHIENLNFLHSESAKQSAYGCLLAIPIVAKKLAITDYRIIANNGAEAGQIVMHLHFHLLADSCLPDF